MLDLYVTVSHMDCWMPLFQIQMRLPKHPTKHFGAPRFMPLMARELASQWSAMANAAEGGNASAFGGAAGQEEEGNGAV